MLANFFLSQYNIPSYIHLVSEKTVQIFFVRISSNFHQFWKFLAER